MKTVTEMVKEAGWSGLYTQWAEPTGKPDWSPVKYSLTVPVTIEQVERFVKLARADEREACAKVCDDAADNVGPIEFDIGASLAAAIRARGNT